MSTIVTDNQLQYHWKSAQRQGRQNNTQLAPQYTTVPYENEFVVYTINTRHRQACIKMVLVQAVSIVLVKQKNFAYKFTPILSLEKGCVCKTTSHPFTVYSKTRDAVVPALCWIQQACEN